jgi:hypothetical protein
MVAGFSIYKLRDCLSLNELTQKSFKTSLFQKNEKRFQ